MTGPAMPSMPLVLVGINHKVAPVQIRERLAHGPERIPAALREALGDGTVIKEAVLLSTCNRVELYARADDPVQAQQQLERFLSLRAGLPPGELEQGLYVRCGQDAALHLMRVAAGLDSLILGENEILGQVRKASEFAQHAGTSGPVLSALFRYAVQAGKRARNETEVGRSELSVACVVVEMAAQVLGSLSDRTALLIGAGKISSITARALLKAGLRCIMVANRTYERAEKLARSVNGRAVRFQELDEHLAQADVVICSTGAPHIVLHVETITRAQKARGRRPLFIADLAVPRDADPQIAGISGIYLRNIDDLDTIARTSHPLTASVCSTVEGIVHDEWRAFADWCSARRCASTIEALNREAEAIYRSEVDHALGQMGPLTARQKQAVQALGKGIAGKLLHKPIVYLRGLPPDEDAAAYIKLVQALYGLP
ncbi:MAG: glutamyl-tRNA reductase [Bacteroidota bacterium]